MIRVFNAVVNPVLAERLRIAEGCLMLLLTHFIFGMAMAVLVLLFIGYLLVVYGQRLFNFAVDCLLGVID